MSDENWNEEFAAKLSDSTLRRSIEEYELQDSITDEQASLFWAMKDELWKRERQ